MHVTVKLFASLARFSPGGLPGTPFELTLPDSASVQDVVDHLGIPVEETKISFVNGLIHDLDWSLKHGDEVGSFHRSVEDESMDITIDTWLYGDLARYGGAADQGSFANIQITLPEYSSVRNLLAILNMPTEERGITFINGNLSAFPDVQPDLDHILVDGDRVAFFHLRSMWPYQYRHGAAMVSELSTILNSSADQGLHHTTV